VEAEEVVSLVVVVVLEPVVLCHHPLFELE
jgi:hypothetical protein